ncbi:MAG: His-Xaa-Ser system radical SAM maturase HxsC [Bacteroidota bacterium]
MLLKTRGTPHRIGGPIVAKLTRNRFADDPCKILIVEDGSIGESPDFKAVLTSAPVSQRIDMPSVYSVGTFDHLAEDDIVVVNSDGSINTLYRTKSFQNFLLATERCNSNCLMCSQPPKDRDDTDYLYGVYSQLIPMIPKDCAELGITGGEPTLMGERFFSLLDMIKKELPETEIHCLTNGRTFAWKNIAQRLERVGLRRLMLGIPLYADHYQVHDYIVQAPHAFHQTIRGLYNLAAFDQRLEIRVVLHRQSLPRLTRLAKFIFMNLPFVEHVAFMGLENQGYTPHNIDKLWIDPADYMNELGEAADFLSGHGINVSIYNSQLCLMPETLWKYNKRSISDWKNIYVAECVNCAMLERCGGLFASCANMHSQHLKAFEQVEVKDLIVN